MSDVLIKNIQIPKDGKRIALFIDKDGEVTVYNGNEFARITDAIEVPTNGRLIQAEEVKKLLQGGLSLDTYEDQAYVCSLIDEIPTIIEANTSPSGFCNTEGCSNSKPDMSKAQNHICPYYKGVCSLDERIICYCQHHYEMCGKFIEDSKG